jgi:hypothetical protein
VFITLPCDAAAIAVPSVQGRLLWLLQLRGYAAVLLRVPACSWRTLHRAAGKSCALHATTSIQIHLCMGHWVLVVPNLHAHKTHASVLCSAFTLLVCGLHVLAWAVWLFECHTLLGHHRLSHSCVRSWAAQAKSEGVSCGRCV